MGGGGGGEEEVVGEEEIVESESVDESTTIWKPNVLNGSVVLVTGGGSGIGQAIAIRMAQMGARGVAVLGRRRSALDETVEKIVAAGSEGLAVQADVRRYDEVLLAVEEVRSRFGSLDILVNNAAGNFLAPAAELSSNGFASVIGIDLQGTFNCCRAAYPALVEPAMVGVPKCVINISATLHHGATPWQAHACAAKAGIDALTRTLAVEWGPMGVRVNGIAPGPIEDTEGIRRLTALGLASSESSHHAKLVEHVPLQRLGQMNEIADAAIFLCSQAAAFISGHTLVVDGAASLHRDPPLSKDDLEAIQRFTRAKKANL